MNFENFASRRGTTAISLITRGRISLLNYLVENDERKKKKEEKGNQFALSREGNCARAFRHALSFGWNPKSLLKRAVICGETICVIKLSPSQILERICNSSSLFCFNEKSRNELKNIGPVEFIFPLSFVCCTRSFSPRSKDKLLSSCDNSWR